MRVAFAFDPNTFSNTDGLRKFYTYFTPIDFCHHMEKCFALRLTADESAAAVAKFRTREIEPSVDGAAFIKYFFDLHAMAWRNHKT